MTDKKRKKTCDRCKFYHQRLFKTINQKTGKDELICGRCIFDIWGMHTHKLEGESGLNR